MILRECVDQCRKVMIEEGKGNYFTGETNLSMTNCQLKERLMALNEEYVITLDIELKVFQSNKLIAILKNDQVNIPDWDLLITQLDSFTYTRLTPLPDDEGEEDFIL